MHNYNTSLVLENEQELETKLESSLDSLREPSSESDPDLQKELSVEGEATHGINVFNGEQITDFANTQSFLSPEVFGFWSNVTIDEVGVFSPGGSQDITTETSLNSIIATHIPDDVSDILTDAFGQDISDIIPEEQLNVPIHESFTIPSALAVEPNSESEPSNPESEPLNSDSGPLELESRIQLPFNFPGPLADNPKFTVENTQEPVTLQDWNQATGNVELESYSDATGHVRIEAEGLLPNAVYTAWSVFAVTEESPEGTEGVSPFAGTPLSGLPNTIVADENGEAVFERDLNYDPLELDNPLMYITLFQHWDNVIYGINNAIEEFSVGLVGSNQLFFPVGNHLLEAETDELLSGNINLPTTEDDNNQNLLPSAEFSTPEFGDYNSTSIGDYNSTSSNEDLIFSDTIVPNYNNNLNLNSEQTDFDVF